MPPIDDKKDRKGNDTQQTLVSNDKPAADEKSSGPKMPESNVSKEELAKRAEATRPVSAVVTEETAKDDEEYVTVTIPREFTLIDDDDKRYHFPAGTHSVNKRFLDWKETGEMHWYLKAHKVTVGRPEKIG